MLLNKKFMNNTAVQRHSRRSEQTNSEFLGLDFIAGKLKAKYMLVGIFWDW
jgi:hypothetical protein